MGSDAHNKLFPKLAGRATFRPSRLARCDVAHFSAWRSPSAHGCWFTGVFVSSSPVWVRGRNHCLAFDHWPLAASRPLQVPFWTGLEEGFLSSASTSNHSDHCPTLVVQVKGLAGGHTKFGSSRSVGDNHCIGTRRSSHRSSVAWTEINVADHGP